MRVLQLGADRSKRGILYQGSPAALRQEAYATELGELDIIGFSLRKDGFTAYEVAPHLRVYPTNSWSRLLYGIDTIRIASRLPRPEVISAQDPFETGFLAWVLSLILRVPLHIQLHTDFLAVGYARHSLLNRARVYCAGFVLKRATRIRVVSHKVRTEISAVYRLKVPVTVLPIFVDVTKFREAIHHVGLEVRFSQFATKLLVVSRLEPEKNVAPAIRAFAQAAPIDACLVVIGSGSERVKLGELVATLHVTDRVFFEGNANPIEYYPFADLVLVTSHYEGYGLVIIEALAAGKPVLATDVGIAREVGALVADQTEYPKALADWFANGPRTAVLKDYPYSSFEDYVHAYSRDIQACVEGDVT